MTEHIPGSDIIGGWQHWIPSAQAHEISQPKPPVIQILGDGGRLTVAVHPDGTIEFGEGVTLDEAARAFWSAVSGLAAGGAA